MVTPETEKKKSLLNIIRRKITQRDIQQLTPIMKSEAAVNKANMIELRTIRDTDENGHWHVYVELRVFKEDTEK